MTHHRLLRESGATDAAHLKTMHPGQRALVAGVRASTRRLRPATLDDRTNRPARPPWSAFPTG
ncbi:hypothetical protein [Streptomyces sp. NPDC054958]